MSGYDDTSEIERSIVGRYQRLNRMFPWKNQEDLVEEVRQETRSRFRSVSKQQFDLAFVLARWSRVQN